MHYQSLQAMNEAHPVRSHGFTIPLVFRPRAGKKDFSESHTAEETYTGQGQTHTYRRGFINTQEGWRSIPLSALRLLQETARDLTEEQFMASEFTIAREGKGVQSRYLCTRISLESAMTNKTSPVVFLTIAYLESGSTVTKEFREEDLERLGGWLPDICDLGMSTGYTASVIVRVDVRSGESVVLKNRWGPQGKQIVSGSLPDGPGSWPYYIHYTGSATPEKVVHYNDGHDDARDLGILRGKADFTATPEVRHLQLPKGPDFVETKVFLPDIDVDKTCRCPMMDLLSTGHNPGCPEKKR